VKQILQFEDDLVGYKGGYAEKKYWEDNECQANLTLMMDTLM
jgi:hypothetical protein